MGVFDFAAVLKTTIALVTVLALATVATGWLLLEVRKEQRAIEEIVAGGVAADIERLGTLPGEVRWQLLFTVLVLFVLIIAGVALVFVARAYFKSLASLREIKILAWDILASMDQGVITTDRKGIITSVNPQGQRLLGIDFDAVGLPLDDLCRDGAPLAETSIRVLESGKSQFDRDFRVTRNGHSAQLRAECHMLRGTSDDVMGTVLHIRDVTERILIEEQMRRMERFMGLGTLAAGLHHEIKNPLTALSLHVQLLEERLEDHSDADTVESLGVLKTEVTRVAGVLESFRDYASLDRLSRKETDMTMLVQQTVDLIRPQAEQQGVEVALTVCGNGLPAIDADPTRLEQVLLNLVMNALDEMENSGKLSVTVRRAGKQIIVEISDSGRGIPDNVRDRIFDPYFTTKNEGSGMGLAVCDKIVRQHGGQIEVDTGASGSTFRISLPVGDS